MTALPITSVFVAIAALALAGLGTTVALTRQRLRVNFGDNGDRVLLRRMRAHGNFVEYVPLALIALALVEYNGAAKWLVWTLGGTLLLARALHAVGILAKIIPCRFAGITLTFLMLIAAGVILLRQVL
jgi:uncharacterized membrane protein YecN with MAPEG domain